MVKLASLIPDEIRSSPELGPLVEQADRWVSEMTDTLPTPFHHEWYRISNVTNPPNVGLRTSTELGTANGVFSPGDLSSKNDFIDKLLPLLEAAIRIEQNMRLKRLHDMGPPESE